MKPTAPKIVFGCESCERTASLRQVRRWLGECRRCSGQQWTIFINYTHKDANTFNVELFSMVDSLVSSSLAGEADNATTNQIKVEHVTAEIVQRLVEDKSTSTEKIVAFAQLKEQQEFTESGGKHCRKCGMLFMPTSDKLWTQHEYCSKLCASKDGLELKSVAAPTEKSEADRSTISVSCPQGHQFSVSKSFAGCLRPCPDCGEKCPVP